MDDDFAMDYGGAGRCGEELLNFGSLPVGVAP
jgi:hypothetical protein